MKKITLSLFTIGMLFAVSSCSKCTTCTKTNSPQLKYCQKDYASKSDYDNAVAATTLLGYDCN